ncbi:MAG TPA: hypothetical protein VIL35_00230 [Vicinamibacterales bacterium]
MSDFSVRADHVDVEQIMRQIRARIRDKRGADYTEAEIRELASVKLDRFLDPRAVRSDLLLHFKRQHQSPPLMPEGEEWPALYTFDPEVIYGSTRDFPRRVLRAIRKLLSPILKLFINPGAITHALHLQATLNAKEREMLERASRWMQTRDELDFELFNNLVVEITRLGIEVKNLRMQVESLNTRLDFDERRARALEGVVQYRPGTPLAPAPSEEEGEEGGAGEPGEGRGPRRRRRRRGRRRGAGAESPVPAGPETGAVDNAGEPMEASGIQDPAPPAGQDTAAPEPSPAPDTIPDAPFSASTSPADGENGPDRS